VPGIDRFGITPETEQKKIEQEAKEEQKDKKIYPHVKVYAERSHKLAAWDIEASPDDNQEGCVKKSKQNNEHQHIRLSPKKMSALGAVGAAAGELVGLGGGLVGLENGLTFMIAQ